MRCPNIPYGYISPTNLPAAAAKKRERLWRLGAIHQIRLHIQTDAGVFLPHPAADRSRFTVCDASDDSVRPQK